MYDRVADVDVRVKSDAQIASMMARKQGYYSELLGSVNIGHFLSVESSQS